MSKISDKTVYRLVEQFVNYVIRINYVLASFTIRWWLFIVVDIDTTVGAVGGNTEKARFLIGELHFDKKMA